MVRVISPVVRRRRIRKYCVVRDIVRNNAAEAECRGIDRIDHRRTGSKVTQERNDSDGHNVIAKPTAIGPATRHYPIAEAWLNLARESIATENAQPIEARVVIVGEVGRPRR